MNNSLISRETNKRINKEDQQPSTQKIVEEKQIIQNKVSYNFDDESSSSDEDDDFVQRFLKLNSGNSSQTIQSNLNQNNIETKKLFKKTSSINNNMQNEIITPQGNTSNDKYNIKTCESESDDDDDEDAIEFQQYFQAQALQLQKYQNLLKELNEEGYFNVTITQVYDQIPEYYWSAFLPVTNADDTIPEKDIEQKYTVKYITLKINTNKELDEKLQQIEIGLLIIGQILNEIEYEVDDQASFLGQFKYHHIKQNVQYPFHLFFAVLHHNESMNREQNSIQDFFSHNNVLVLEPDYVLYPTLIAQSMYCYRTPLIKMKFCMTESTNWNMLKGTILHDIFEYLMEMHKNNEINLLIEEGQEGEYFQKIIRSLYTKYIEDLFLLGKSIEEFEKEIKYIARTMIEFIQNFLVNGQQYVTQESKRKIKIIKLVENEMVVNNETLGLKGQIDCIFLCEVEETVTNEKYKCFLPFELKTGGRKRATYEDQSLFYCLLLNQKYHHKKNLEGFLYYLSLNQIISLSPTRRRTQGLLVRRNKLAKMIKKMENEGIMPAIKVGRPDICTNCFEKEACYSSQIADDYDTLIDLEDVAGNYKLDKEFVDFHRLYDSMTEGSKRYLKKWLDLIQKEQQFDRSYKKDKKSKLLAEVDNELSFMTQNFNEFYENQINQFQSGYQSINSASFMSQSTLSSKNSSRETNTQNENEIYLKLQKKFTSVSKMITVMDYFKEGESLVINQPDIKSKFKVILTEKLVDDENLKIILTLKPIQDQVNYDDKKVKTIVQKNLGNFLKWSIESYNKDQYPDQRQNVINLILNKIANQSKDHEKLIQNYNLKQSNNNLISAIIDNFPPTFQNKDFDINNILNKYPALLKNVDQANSVRKILSSDSLTCVLGMPGTGKTFLIAHLIKILADQNRVVLVTSFTNSALDNIIIKLFELFPEIKNLCFRKGSNKNLIHPIAQEVLYNPYSFKEQSQFVEYFEKKRIFFSTIIGSNNKLFHSDKIYFDFCIIDEASQCVEPLCLGPMLQCKKSVLIGDHNQLQPLVKNKEAGEKGLSISLFERMCTSYPNCVTELRNQFRMNNQIMELSNIMVYEGKLKAFDENIATRQITINESLLSNINSKSLQYCINPHNKVTFIDTSCMMQGFDLETLEEYDGKEENVFQLKLICIRNKNIACITAYNFFRIKLIKNLSEMNVQQDDLELFTVDKSQGIDKDIIILHCCDKIGNEHLLTNWRRTNVALTRSKMKLIMIGNIKILKEYKVVQDLIKILENKNYIYSLQQEEVQDLNQK